MITLNADSAADYVRKQLSWMEPDDIEIWDARRMVEEDRRVHYIVTGDCIASRTESGIEMLSFEWIVWQEPDGQIIGEEA